MTGLPWLPFGLPPPKVLTGRELMLDRMRNGIPPELACAAAGVDWLTTKEEPEVAQAVAEGEILLFERARDGGVSGAVRAAMRYETKTWTPKAEANPGASVEDLLRD